MEFHPSDADMICLSRGHDHIMIMLSLQLGTDGFEPPSSGLEPEILAIILCPHI